MAHPTDVESELEAAVGRILESPSRKKLVVAGPGAGKTTLFRKLLDAIDGDAAQRLVLTFINALKDDLDRSLGDAATVFTLHGYCQHLLHREADLRNGLSGRFRCYPGLASLIKTDWRWLEQSTAPPFVQLMRDLNCSEEHATFYFGRANYYDAVDFDDSVYRTYREMEANPHHIPGYSLVLIDEFQDFNAMEAAVIDLLAADNPILIAGDDDQALYSQLRGASWDHIRARHASGDYEIFELPFCMRCPEVIVEAVNDIIRAARGLEKLNGRIEKPYRYYDPVKGEDSRRYPHIELVETSVQRNNANYFGQYIEQCVAAMPTEELQRAAANNEPAVLVIGSNPYRAQVEAYLTKAGLYHPPDKSEHSEREIALQFLAEDPESNLGWRIMLACSEETTARDVVVIAAEQHVSLASLIPDSERTAVLGEATEWAAAHAAEHQGEADGQAVPPVAITSYEGAKGRSAPYVFLLGLQSGDLPRKPAEIQDIEICRFLVGLTRTKRKCSILVTRRFGQQFKQRSEFIAWIGPDRLDFKQVDAAYWRG